MWPDADAHRLAPPQGEVAHEHDLKPVGRIRGVDQPLDRLAVDDDGLVLLDLEPLPAGDEPRHRVAVDQGRVRVQRHSNTVLARSRCALIVVGLFRSGRVVVVIALCAFEVMVSVVRTCDASSGWRIVHFAQQVGGAEP